LGVVLYTDGDGDPCWLSFVDEQGVSQNVGFSGEGELSVAEDGKLTYLGGGGVSLQVIETRTGEAIEYQVKFSRTAKNEIHLQAGHSEPDGSRSSQTDLFSPVQYGITEAQLKGIDLPDFPGLELPALISYYLHTDGAGAEGAASELYRRFMEEPTEIIRYLSLCGDRSYERNGETVNQSVNAVISDAIATAAVFWNDSADELRMKMSGCPVGESGGSQLVMKELRSALETAELRHDDTTVHYTDWTLDGPYTEQNNMGLSLREQFGTALGENPNYVILGDDGTIKFAFGVFFGSGVCEPDGDTGRTLARVLIYPEELEQTLILYEHRKSPDSAGYLVMEYGGYQLFWKEK